MELIKKSFNGNHTMMLHFQVPARVCTLTSSRFVIGGMVTCQFKVEIVSDHIAVSKLFDMIDKNLDVCYPIISCQCSGIDFTPNEIDSDSDSVRPYRVPLPCKISDDIIAPPNGIWLNSGLHLVLETKTKYDIHFTISINTIRIRPSPFKVLHEDTTLTDFELCGGDGSINVHKAVLASSSPVLNSMLSGQWKETAKGKVELASITKETLQDLKDFIYLRKLPETPDKDEVQRRRLEELLKLASYLMMSDLIQACSYRLLLDLTDENVCETLSLSGMHNVDCLTKAILLCAEIGTFNLMEKLQI